MLGRGLPSSEKLAEYWFLTIFDSQGDPLKPLGPFGGFRACFNSPSIEALGEPLKSSEGFKGF